MILQSNKFTKESLNRPGMLQSSTQNLKTKQIHSEQGIDQLTLRKNNRNANGIKNKQNRELMNSENEGLRQKYAQKLNIDKNLMKTRNNMSRVTDQKRIQDLKNRFREIKCSYENNHKQINTSIQNCLQNYNQQFSQTLSRSQSNEFQISREQLSFSQNRNSNNQSEYSFHEKNQEIPFQVGKNTSKLTGKCDQNLNSLQLNNKYGSLSRQLQTFRQGQLIDILIEEIEDNQKNKHVISEQKYSNDLLKKQLDSKEIDISKLKNEIECKREQIEILLATEKKNLQIIQKLKKNITQKQENSHPNDQSFTPSQLDKLKREYSLPIMQNDTITNMNMKESFNDSDVYKRKHDELEKYMNEYINNVNEAYEEYKRNLLQLKQNNLQLKEQYNNLTSQLKESFEANNNLSHQLNILQRESQKLSHSLSNSKIVIEQLEQQFSILKEENIQLTSIISNNQYKKSDQKNKIQTQYEEIKHLRKTNKNIIEQLDQLIARNYQLANQNYLLNKDLKEIQEKIINNNDIESEIKEIIITLTQQKFNIQKELQNSLKTIRNFNQTHPQSQNQEHQADFVTQHQQPKQQIVTLLKSQVDQFQKVQKQIITQAQQLTKLNHNLNQQNSNLNQRISDLTEENSHLNNQIHLLTESNSHFTQQNNILEQTNSQMQKLQSQLLQEYQTQNQQKNILKNELISIMHQVKQMQAIYQNELSSNENIKTLLQNYWNNQSHPSPHIQSLNKIHLPFDQIQKKSSSRKLNYYSDDYSADHQNFQSCQISFKKNSKLTKQGSSSVFKQNIISQEIIHQSKVSQPPSLDLDSPIDQGSFISEKYFSQTEQQQKYQLTILQTSKNNNSNSLNQIKINSNQKPLSLKK